MGLSSLGQRVVTALVLVPLVLAALFLLPPRGWAIVALAIVLVAAYEWGKLVGHGKAVVAFVAATLALGAALLFGVGGSLDHGWPVGIVAVFCGVATLFWVFVAPFRLARATSTGGPLAMALVGWIVLIGAWVALVDLQARSPWLVLAAMAIVWVADTAAYFAGRQFGQRKLAPTISPGKTWEGVAGAMIAVGLYALALVPLARAAGYRGVAGALAIALFVLLLLALTALSIVGDLYESLLKRHAGVKDSGKILPGHGGVLDRVDALLAAMPPAALAATVFLHPGAAR